MPNPSIDWGALITVGARALEQLFGGSSSQEQALEKQRIKLEESLRQKIEGEFKTTQLLLAGLGILLILALLLRR